MGQSLQEAIAARLRAGLGERPRSEWLRLGVIAALALAVVAEAAETTVELWRLVRRPPLAHLPSMRPNRAADAGPALQALVDAHLFGKAPDAPAEAPKEAAAQWVLTGTLQGDTPDSGAAILGSSASSTRFCAAGQEVAGGFRLVEVFPDRVTLERAGERLSLKLPRAIRAAIASPLLRVASAADPATTRVQQSTLEERLRERPAYQTPALLELRPSLHRGVGRFDGMRIWGTGDGSNLAPYGLQRNDIIREVDGQPVNNMPAQQRALQALSAGHPVEVTVDRNGSLFRLQLAFSFNESDSGS